MKVISVLLPLAMLVLTDQAAALGLNEAQQLAREADVETIESVFTEHQAAFNTAKITAGEFNSPYWAFNTTEPRVLELVDAWRAAKPDSPQAMVAKAGTLTHQAIVIRGNGLVRNTPKNSIARMRSLYAEARPLLMRVLDTEARQIFAAEMITTVAPFLGDRAGDLRAHTVLREHGDPVALFFDDLIQLLPQCGGSEAEMRQFCRQEVHRIDTISAAECDAYVTIKLLRGTYEMINAAIETLGSEGDDHWVATRAEALIEIGRPREALDLFERNDYWIGWSYASTLARALGNPSILKRTAQRWLVLNPYHPRHLAHLAWALDLEGDIPGALKAADDAMRYGATIPEARMARLWLMSKNEDRKWGLLEEFEDAIAQTNAHSDVTDMVTAALYRPAPYLTHQRDGSPTPNFECRRLRIFLQHAAACQWSGRTDRNCNPNALAQVVNPILEEARRAGQCRDMQNKTWRQLVEEWLP